MRNALFYLTYNGLYNFTNGIGTQTQLLLGGLETLREDLVAAYGSLDVHVICPLPDAQTWGYDPAFLALQRERVSALGGRVHLIPYKTQPHQDLWDMRSWTTLCQNVAPLLHAQTAFYDRSLVICVDQPWLQTPHVLASHRDALSPAIDMLLVLYNTAFIRNWEAPDAAEVAWEQDGLDAAQPESCVAIADVCPSFTTHLTTHFQLATARFAPYTSSILVNDPIFALQDETAIRSTLQAYGVPLDADLVLAFGRAAPIKGFDRLIPALAPLRDRLHLVLISVPYIHDDSEQRVFDQLLQQHQLPATHIKQFTRELPRALCQWPGTKMVAVPSRHETFSNIPLEVALWARDHGPVTVTSTAGGFADQIEPGRTGFFVDLTSVAAMTQTLHQVLDLSPHAHAAIRRQAYQRVVQAYDFARNFPETLRWFWQPAESEQAGP
jgi:glycosyltransferase involved in cell wall biosynthesis